MTTKQTTFFNGRIIKESKEVNFHFN